MFNENLKTLRREKGFSQEQLALRMNVVRQTVSKWEKGLSVPDAQLLVKLAEVLDVPVTRLLGDSAEIEKNEKDTEVIAAELSKLNEILVVYGEKASRLKKQIVAAIGVILIIILLCAIYEPWADTWHRFGQNLYHCVNG